MASLLDLISPNLTQWRDTNQNALLGLGTSLLSDGMDFSGVQRGAAMDQEKARLAQEEQRKSAEREALKGWIGQTRPELAPLLDAGIDGGALVSEALKPAGGETGNLPKEYELYQLAQQDPAFAEYLQSQGGGSSQQQPAAVQEYQFAVSQGYDKPYTAFIQEKGRNSGTPPATIAKEIFEADEGAQAGQNVILALDRALELNNTAGDGPLADAWSTGASLLGDPRAVQTQELKNIVTANALESLKATFGAAPTEGERKILLEIQGSVNQSRPVREAIFKRAKAAAERRLKFNTERANSLRSGGYFEDGYSPVGGAPGDDIEGILSGMGL